MLHCLCKYIATFFLIGKLPAPGTLASAATLVLYCFALSAFDAVFFMWLEAICSLILFFIGWAASSVHSKNVKQADPGEIVIDEVAGQFVALSLLHMLTFSFEYRLSRTLCFLCFCMFRALDITKPWPISWADSHVKGGLGIVLDDILAALIASPIVLLICKLTQSMPYISGKLTSFLVH